MSDLNAKDTELEVTDVPADNKESEEETPFVLDVKDLDYISLLERRNQSRLIMIAFLVIFIVVILIWNNLHAIKTAVPPVVPTTQASLNLGYRVSFVDGTKVVEPTFGAVDIEKNVAAALDASSIPYSSELSFTEFQTLSQKTPLIMISYSKGKTLQGIDYTEVAIPVNSDSFPEGTFLLKTDKSYRVFYNEEFRIGSIVSNLMR